MCGKSVNKATCQDIAAKDEGYFNEENDPNKPKGCYYNNGLAEYYYNSADSTVECSSSYKCYCGVDEEIEGKSFLIYISN